MNARERPFQFRLRTLLIAMTVVGVLLAAFVMWDRAMDRILHAVLVGKTGPIESREEWPRPLIELAEDSSALVAVESVKVFCLCQGFDPEYVWRMDGDSELLSHLIQRWRLTQITNPRSTVFQGYSHNSGIAVPDWWEPWKDSDIVYHLCPATLAGDKGDRFQVAFSEAEKAIYVHYWFNF
jgi:hypothetical protein